MEDTYYDPLCRWYILMFQQCCRPYELQSLALWMFGWYKYWEFILNNFSLKKLVLSLFLTKFYVSNIDFSLNIHLMCPCVDDTFRCPIFFYTLCTAVANSMDVWMIRVLRISIEYFRIENFSSFFIFNEILCF